MNCFIKIPLIFWVGWDRPIFTTNLTLKEINKRYALNSYYTDTDELGEFSACLIKTNLISPILLKRYRDSDYTCVYINSTQNVNLAQQYITSLLKIENNEIQWFLKEQV